MTAEGTPGKEKIEAINSMIVEAQIVGQNTLASFLGDTSFMHFLLVFKCV